MARPVEGEREQRTVPIEARADGADGNGLIFGYAARFDQPAEVRDYEEVIRRGAFSDAIARGDDVFALMEHDKSRVIGRTRNKTLTLKEDAIGLFISATPPDTQEGRDARALVKSGYLDGMSFGFTVEKQKWTIRGKQPDLREILQAKLWEVSIVAFPAYEGTSASARSKETDVTPPVAQVDERAENDKAIAEAGARARLNLQICADWQRQIEAERKHRGL